MKNTDGKQHFAKSLQAIGLTVVFLMVASPGESFGQTPVGSKHSAVPPPATAIAPEEVAARSSEVTNLVITCSEKFAVSPEIGKIQQALPEINKQIDLDAAAANVRALKRVAHAKKLLEETGVNPDRLEFYHVAASQGPLFATTSAEFTERIKRLNNGGNATADTKSAEDSTGEGS